MTTTQISLAKLIHRNQEIVSIRFAKNDEILSKLRKIGQLRWSQTHRCWYLPYSPDVTRTLRDALSSIARITFTAIQQNSVPEAPAQASKTHRQTNPSPAQRLTPLSESQAEQVTNFKHWMLSRRYSQSTIGTYTDALSVFLRYFHHKTIEQINNEDLINFNNQYIIANQLSASYQNQVVNAIKLFFRTKQMRAMDVELVHRPKRAHLLPNVLSKEEVKMILGAHSNFKHSLMLSLIYACGLRRSELINLKLNDISSERRLLTIRQSKGKKDRIVPISEQLIDLLRKYYLLYKPTYWLFEGQVKGEKYSGETLQQVLKLALTKAKINKPVTLHWLRHSYATHLLEKGTDLRYIQELLGHNSSRTTEIYTHVSQNSIQKIISPFDEL